MHIYLIITQNVEMRKLDAIKCCMKWDRSPEDCNASYSLQVDLLLLHLYKNDGGSETCRYEKTKRRAALNCAIVLL